MKEIDKDTLILIVIISEVILLTIAFFLAIIFHIEIHSLIIIDLPTTLYALVAALILTALNFIVVFILPKFLSVFKPMREAYDEVCHIVANAQPLSAILIAILSGLAEEILFRGVIQQITGILIASILFGVLHIYNKKTIFYGLYAIFIGYYLGLIYIYTQSLWAPILVHMINNAIAIPFMKRHYKIIKGNQINENTSIID
ncbi:MAG: CPBP family intramembrane glutamic endopeptidase [Cyanobacteriota bacterium]